MVLIFIYYQETMAQLTIDKERMSIKVKKRVVGKFEIIFTKS